MTSALALVAACGGATTPTVETSTIERPTVVTTAPISNGSPETTVAPGGAYTSPSTAAPAPPDDRDVAPEFTLTLQPDGEFVLSQAGKPVYLVFWAEW